MIILSFNNLKNLNVSLQVGDGVYARGVIYQRSDASGNPIGLPQDGLTLDTGKNYFVGILKNIDDLGNNQYDLHVDDDPTAFPFSVNNPYLGSYYSPGASEVVFYFDPSDTSGNSKLEALGQMLDNYYEVSGKTFTSYGPQTSNLGYTLNMMLNGAIN